MSSAASTWETDWNLTRESAFRSTRGLAVAGLLLAANPAMTPAGTRSAKRAKKTLWQRIKDNLIGQESQHDLPCTPDHPSPQCCGGRHPYAF